jgi:hypothetical protein
MLALQRRRGRRRATTVFALACVPALAAAGVVWAASSDVMFTTYNTGDGRCWAGLDNGYPCQTDNKAVYFYMDSNGAYELESPDRSVVNAVIDGEYRPTDLAFHYDSSPVFTGTGQTDIVYQEGDAGLGDSVRGVTWCNFPGNDVVDCDQQYVRIRGAGKYTYSTTCHETGHAVGLQHGEYAYPPLPNDDIWSLGCMVTPDNNTTFLGELNTSAINATY